MEPCNLEQEKLGRTIIERAIRITEGRIQTSTEDKYISYKGKELLGLKHIKKFSHVPINGTGGILGEALFDLIYSRFVSLVPSNGDEDYKDGIDFFLNGFPIDVTTDLRGNNINKKVKPEKYTTILLPNRINSPIAFPKEEDNNNPNEYITHLLETGDIDIPQYMVDLYAINFTMLEHLERHIWELESNGIRNAGLNNVTNLRTILELLPTP